MGIIPEDCKFEKRIISFVFTSFALFPNKLKNSKQEIVIVVIIGQYTAGWSMFYQLPKILSLTPSSCVNSWKSNLCKIFLKKFYVRGTPGFLKSRNSVKFWYFWHIDVNWYFFDRFDSAFFDQ